MHSCRSFAADLDLLASGVLPPDRMRGAETHLAGCVACRARYECTLALCAELSVAGKAIEPPDAAVWRLRGRVRTAVTGTATGAARRWQVATATATATAVLACAALFVHRDPPPARPPGPVAASSAAPAIPDPPLTLLACERAAARSDAALEQILSRDAARPCSRPGEESLRAFSPASLAILDRNNRLP